MPCLVRYKSIVRKDFFGDLPGVVGVHGEPWREFRSRVQKPVLQLTTVRRYVRPLEEVTDYFIERCQQMLDENQELPDDFDNEIHKWSLECEYNLAKDKQRSILANKCQNISINHKKEKLMNSSYVAKNMQMLNKFE